MAFQTEMYISIWNFVESFSEGWEGRTINNLSQLSFDLDIVPAEDPLDSGYQVLFVVAGDGTKFCGSFKIRCAGGRLLDDDGHFKFS